MRPSAKTSILAPTRWGVDPVVDTIVTSAAGSPRSSASATAAKTSRFISVDYMRDAPCPPSADLLEWSASLSGERRGSAESLALLRSDVVRLEDCQGMIGRCSSQLS